MGRYRLDTATYASPVDLGMVRLRVMNLGTLVGVKGTQFTLTYRPADAARVHEFTRQYLTSRTSRLEAHPSCERFTGPVTSEALASLLSPVLVAQTGEILNWERFEISDAWGTIFEVEEHGSFVHAELSDEDLALAGKLGLARWLIPD